MLFDKGKLEIFYLSWKLSMSLTHCYTVLWAFLIKWGKESQAFANASQPPTQKNPVWACFKETVVLGSDDSSFPLSIKKPDDKYVLGAQGYGLNIQQWIAIMWKVDLEIRQWRTHAGAVFIPPCMGQLARDEHSMCLPCRNHAAGCIMWLCGVAFQSQLSIPLSRFWVTHPFLHMHLVCTNLQASNANAKSTAVNR